MLRQARQGEAWRGTAGQAWRGWARPGTAGEARHGAAWPGEATHGVMGITIKGPHSLP
jgi:hypothetical protein